jgi:hypothetical protein
MGSGNADAVFGNGQSTPPSVACGLSFTCAFPSLSGNPFANPVTDVGILSPSGRAVSPPGPSVDFSNLLLTTLDQSGRTIEGDQQEELMVVLLGRRLPLCR